jgi:hypothetical protein
MSLFFLLLVAFLATAAKLQPGGAWWGVKLISTL